MKKKEFLYWSKQRQKGIWKFILMNGVLSWGVPMLIYAVFISKSFEQGFTVKAAAVHCTIWLFGGVLFGLFLWIINEHRFKKQVVKNAA